MIVFTDKSCQILGKIKQKQTKWPQTPIYFINPPQIQYLLANLYYGHSKQIWIRGCDKKMLTLKQHKFIMVRWWIGGEGVPGANEGRIGVAKGIFVQILLFKV